MTDPRPRLAINPLPWILDPHRGFHLDEASLRTAFKTVSALGFTAVQADIPKGWSVERYREFRDGYGLESAPGYFSARFDIAGTTSAIIEAAKEHAKGQLALGLTQVFIAGAPAPERRLEPAVGAQFDEQRLQVQIDQLGSVAHVLTREGLTPALHPHIATWIETERETRAVLDGIPSSTLAFGPDTGHLAWAGIDPASIMADYRERIAAVHIKDVDASAIARAANAHAVYAEATSVHHVWTEPGRGAVDFDAVLAALPIGFGGWAVIEVDVPNIGDAAESSAESAKWARSRPEFAG